MADLEGGTALSLDRHLGASDTAEAIESYTEIEIPESLRDNLVLFLRMERKVLKEYDPAVCALFDRLFNSMIRANEGNPGTVAADEPTDAQGIPTADTEGARAFREAVELIDALPVDQAQVVVRAFTSFFHLANLSEENYRVETLRELERNVSMESAVDTSNELVVAYGHLLDEVGPERTAELLGRLEFHPVFTAHPTEARRKAVEGKIRRIAALLDEHPYLGGSALLENERHMLQEIDALVRTSPTELKKPTPLEEADTIIDIFDNTLFDTVPQVYRRFDDWVLGGRRQRAARVPGVLPSGQLDRVGPRRQPERHCEGVAPRGGEVLRAYGGQAGPRMPQHRAQPHAGVAVHRALGRAYEPVEPSRGDE